jgi:hypothetical protein
MGSECFADKFLILQLLLVTPSPPSAILKIYLDSFDTRVFR